MSERNKQHHCGYEIPIQTEMRTYLTVLEDKDIPTRSANSEDKPADISNDGYEIPLQTEMRTYLTVLEDKDIPTRSVNSEDTNGYEYILESDMSANLTLDENQVRSTEETSTKTAEFCNFKSKIFKTGIPITVVLVIGIIIIPILVTTDFNQGKY